MSDKNPMTPYFRNIAKIAGAALLAVALAACAGASTKIKYVFHAASAKVKLPDGTIRTAPEGNHYGLFLINCIDNATRDDGFLFLGANLRDGENRETQLNEPAHGLPLPSRLVGTGDIETEIGQIVFELTGRPTAGIIEHLYYKTTGEESVIMINQTHYGALIAINNTPIDVASMTSAPGFDDDLCKDAASNPHP